MFHIPGFIDGRQAVGERRGGCMCSRAIDMDKSLYCYQVCFKSAMANYALPLACRRGVIFFFVFQGITEGE